MITINYSSNLTALTTLQGKLINITPVLESIGYSFSEFISLQFRESKDPYGVPWRPLSKVTLDRRRDNGREAKILVDTSLLSQSFTSSISSNKLTMGVGSPANTYAGTQQWGAAKRSYKGGKTPWGDIPARKMLPLQDNEVVLPALWHYEMLDIVIHYLGVG